jgi:very-short-patch-repair endonuclease
MPPKRIRNVSQPVQQRARELRQEMTPAEKILWHRLRNRGFKQLKFRRQQPLGPFIADFYCAEHRLIVEIDGPVHEQQQERDTARTAYFEQQGYRLIRFRNQAVETELATVLAAIRDTCREGPHPRPLSHPD